MSYVETLKVCGQTIEADVEESLRIGADYVGLITYAESPRAISLQRAGQLAESIPAGRAVLVDVEPSVEKLLEARASGIDKFQIHFSLDQSGIIADYVQAVGSGALWLAPRLKPGAAFPDRLTAYADVFLLDAYSPTQVGGTGERGDWNQFARLQKRFSEKRWILAGGLSPDNVAEALQTTGARHIDVNSGVETSPGRKNAQRLRELGRRLGRI